MTFKRVFRGYDPKQVDAYLKSKTESDNMVLQAQRERVDQLVDENNRMKAQIAKYKADEQAISQALIQSQHLATKMQNDADKYAEVVLTRAKLFYAAWQAYAQTLVTSLSTQELAQFTKISWKNWCTPTTGATSMRKPPTWWWVQNTQTTWQAHKRNNRKSPLPKPSLPTPSSVWSKQADNPSI